MSLALVNSKTTTRNWQSSLMPPIAMTTGEFLWSVASCGGWCLMNLELNNRRLPFTCNYPFVPIHRSFLQPFDRRPSRRTPIRRHPLLAHHAHDEWGHGCGHGRRRGRRGLGLRRIRRDRPLHGPRARHGHPSIHRGSKGPGGSKGRWDVSTYVSTVG